MTESISWSYSLKQWPNNDRNENSIQSLSFKKKIKEKSWRGKNGSESGMGEDLLLSFVKGALIKLMQSEHWRHALWEWGIKQS